jgi:membrane protease YdiL (CAAX protease family)
MSPDDPKYLPADGASRDEPTDVPNIQQPPRSMYDDWDRGNEPRERAEERRPPPPTARPSNSIFAFLEVTYPWRPRFPFSLLWAMFYFALGMVACVCFWIFCQLIPAIVTIIGLIIFNSALYGADQALSSKGLQVLQEQSIAPTLIAGHIAAVTLGVILLRFILGPDWLRRMAVRLPSLWHLLLTLLLVPALYLLANLVFALTKLFLPSLGDLLGMPMPGMEQMVKLFGTWPWWLAVLVVGLGPAISEELWCRGLIGLGLFGRNGIAVRLLVSAFYFGLLHVDPQQGTMAAVLGIVLYFVLFTTRCFWMPVLIHFSINSTSVIAARFESASAIDQRPEDIPLVLYAGAFVLFVTLRCSLVRTRTRLVAADGHGPLLWEPVYAGLEHPPANSGVVVKWPRPDLIDVCLVVLGFGTFAAALAWSVVYG